MKRIWILILSAAMLFGCASCQIDEKAPNDQESTFESTLNSSENESATAPNDGEILPPVLFSSYDDILNTVSLLAKNGEKEAFEASMPKLDAREQAIYQTLCSLTTQMLGKPTQHTMRASHLDIDDDGTEELYVTVTEGDIFNTTFVEGTQTVFTFRGGVPVSDNGSLLDRYRQMTQEERPHISKIAEPLVTHAHYKIMEVNFQNGQTKDILYEIYASDGTLVKTGEANTSFWGYCQGDLIEFSAYHPDYHYTTFFYSIRQNKFSEDFPGFIKFSSEKVAYIRDGILTVQDIFDRNVYYQEFSEYRGVYNLYFAEDGKSVSFRHVVEGAKKDATSVICFEELPIIRAIKICYIRTGPGTNYDVLMPSSGTYAYLRSATQDTARLLQAEPVIGGSYESDNGTVRNDWYKISYNGKVYYVSADSFEVDTYRITN